MALKDMFQLPDHFGLFTGPAKKAEREAEAVAHMRDIAEAINEEPLLVHRVLSRTIMRVYWKGFAIGAALTAFMLWRW